MSLSWLTCFSISAIKNRKTLTLPKSLRYLRAFFAHFVVKKYDKPINSKNRDVAPTALGFLTLIHYRDVGPLGLKLIQSIAKRLQKGKNASIILVTLLARKAG